jgi:hypothetical protein
MACPWVRLYYTFTASQMHIDYRIHLQTTYPRFGGLRWWFLCPLTVNGYACSRRVGKLYLPPGSRYFGCRHCYALTYTSCQESRKYDGWYALIAKSLPGATAADVKGAMSNWWKS